jgi:hypothetical protein
MSTRSIIARPEGDGFAGRYCHWDGYPTCRGAQIWEAMKELDGDVEKLIGYAIREDDPGYWSSFQTPLKAAEMRDLPPTEECHLCDGTGIRPDWARFGDAPGCNACGGSVGRGGQAKVGTGVVKNRAIMEGYIEETDGSWVESWGDDCGTEWAYVIAPHALYVFERRFGAVGDDHGHGTGMFGMGASDTEVGGHWAPRAEIRWDAEEPDWEAIEQGTGVPA